MRVAIYKHHNPKKKWCVLFPNGKSLCGYDSADHAKGVVERAGSYPIVMSGKATNPNELVWIYGRIGNLEYWRAEFFGKIVATAERNSPDDLWTTTLLGKEHQAVASISDLAQELNNKFHSN